ncbi:type I restriction endonuclease subunit R [Ornithobacterium rhinotracheale]|uniref:type I restriction endonuclease subunit R n=1 Tax=Ornithobacterium rhinotracheale TaxID=28251 RepID=UPI001FF61CCB|nr:type I restriction endonuclease subunit R [Ornithobacterium rhinotracheale]MCK0201386.1 type I restriction endonuclease subunit R [Ornithobacterium rhinotracheale]
MDKMVFSEYIWSLYKETKVGTESINGFRSESTFWNDYNIIQKYNPEEGKWIDRWEYQSQMQEIGETLSSQYTFNFKTLSDVRAFYEQVLDNGIYYEIDGGKNYIVEPKDYQYQLQLVTLMSFLFYEVANDFTFPYLFKFRFFDINRISDTFNIKIPEIPKKSDYRNRCLYYIDLCEVFYKFRKKHGLTPPELCSFLYDFSLNLANNGEDEIPVASQSWLIGGKTDKTEENLNRHFWQASPDTKKGDILFHYEKYPVSAINSVFTAQTDGVIDPFFHYYSNTYIGQRKDITKVSLKELKEDVYFKAHPLVKKNFQGVNGYPMSSEDYRQLIRLIKDKNGVVESIPELYQPNVNLHEDIKIEQDVENKLLEKYLSEIGLVKGKDFVKQLPIKAGRGNSIYPDYALYFDSTKNYEKAKVLIEAKYHMKSNKDIESAFVQARSYANLLESSLIVLCDKVCLLIYEKNGSFDRDKYRKIYWEELNTTETFNYLKNTITKNKLT